MKVVLLQRFLSSLQGPIQALGAEIGLDSLLRALDPYRDLDIDTYSAFLRDAEEARRQGKVDIPGKHDEAVKKIHSTTRHLAVELDAAMQAGDDQWSRTEPELEKIRNEVATAISMLGAQVGLKITAKSEGNWIGKQRDQIRLLRDIEHFRQFASGIQSPDGFAQAVQQPEFSHFRTKPINELKILATALNVAPKGKAPQDFADDMLGLLSGHRPATAKVKSGKKAPAFTPDDLQPHVQRLKDLRNRSNVPGALSLSDIAAEEAVLKSMQVDMFREVMRQAGIQVAANASKPELLKIVHRYLAAGHQALERIEA